MQSNKNPRPISENIILKEAVNMPKLTPTPQLQLAQPFLQSLMVCLSQCNPEIRNKYKGDQKCAQVSTRNCFKIIWSNIGNNSFLFSFPLTL